MSEIGTFTVTLADANGTVTPAAVVSHVHYADAPGTAVAGTDYIASSGILTFNVGDSTKTIIVPILADPTANVAKSFRMVLSTPDGALIGSASSGLCVISTSTAVIAPPPTQNIVVTVPSVSIVTGVTAPVLTALSASGNQFVDASGAKVWLRSIAWYGFDGPDLIPHGLYAGRGYKDVLDQISQLGFNCVRLPFADDMITSTVTFSGTGGNQYVSLPGNADMVGLTPLQALDRIIIYGASIGLRFVLDHHRISILPSATPSTPYDASGYGTDGWPAADPTTGLYLYGGSTTGRAYTAATWLAMWTTLATHCTTGVYATNLLLKNAIVGFEPHNEPFHPSWATWAGMCEVLIPQILAIAPDWMAFVDGVGASADGTDTYWFGGYLKDVATRPINLGAKQSKLAYSAHDYGQSVSAQKWLANVVTAGGNGYPGYPTANTPTGYPANLEAIFDEYWGFIYRQNIGPMWLGEFGGGLGADYNTGADDPNQVNAALEVQWIDALVQYLGGTRNDGTSMVASGAEPMSFSYFSLNPESGNPLGGLLLNADYLSVSTRKMDAILPLLAQ